MSRKGILIIFLCAIIFATGFILRVESVNLTGIPSSEQAYYHDQNGLPYMYEMDSYYNYRLTRNYIEHGYIGDIKVNGKNWDLHSHYPPGVEMNYPPVIVYVAAFFYKVVNLFANVPLIVTCFWLPAFVGPISGIIVYLFVRRFTNEYGGFAAGLLVVTVPFYFLRTIPGWFDTDMFNVLFPILIMWFIVEAISNENPKKSSFSAVLAAFATAIFSIAWNGWSYVFYIILGSFMVYMVLFKAISLRKSQDFHLKSTLKIFLIYLLTTITFLFFLGTLVKLLAPLSFLRITVHTTWPNINVSVSELVKPSFEEFLSALGLVFFTGIFGFIWILRVLINEKLRKQQLPNFKWFFYVLLIIWTVIGLFSLKYGSRFIILLIPPRIVSSGVMVGICVEYFKILKHNPKFKIFQIKKASVIILTILLIMMAIPSALSDLKDVPILKHSVNDYMMDASAWLNQNTTNETVIFSDWSYGHFFTASADRPFSIDGGSTNTPRAYWIYKAFSTDNETLSLGIFKMIATTGDLGYLTLDNYTKNSTKTAEIMNSILGLDKNSALNVLTKNYNLSTDQAVKIVNITHPDNSRPFLVLTYNDMLNDGYWNFFFGEWNFTTLKGYDCTYSHGNITGSSKHFETTNGVTIDPETGTAKWYGEVPYSLITVEKGVVKETYLNINSDNCIVLQMDTKQDLVISKEFENSTFIKMVLERNNMTYFNRVYENEAVSVWEPKMINY